MATYVPTRLYDARTGAWALASSLVFTGPQAALSLLGDDIPTRMQRVGPVIVPDVRAGKPNHRRRRLLVAAGDARCACGGRIPRREVARRYTRCGPCRRANPSTGRQIPENERMEA